MHTDHRLAIASPASRVFALVDDPLFLPRLQGMSCELVGSPDPARYVLRTRYAGMVYDYDCAILERAAPRRLVTQCIVAGRRVQTEWDLEGSAATTTLRLRTHVEVRPGVLGWMDRLMDFKGSYWAERSAHDTLEAVRRSAEGA